MTSSESSMEFLVEIISVQQKANNLSLIVQLLNGDSNTT